MRLTSILLAVLSIGPAAVSPPAAQEEPASVEPGPATPEPTAGESADPAHETRSFPLRYLDVDTALSVVRSVLQTRNTALVRDTRTIVIRDEAAILEQAARLIEELDVPPPQWRIELCLDTPRGERVIRELRIEDKPLSLSYGTADDRRLTLRLDPRQPSGAGISLVYDLEARIRYDEGLPPFGFVESGKATVTDGEGLELLRATRPGLEQALAALVGHPGEAARLFLRFRRSVPAG